MKRLCLATALVVAMPAPMAQTLTAPTFTVETFGSRTHFTEQGGPAIYLSVCAACHMPDGRGASGAGSYPSLAQNQRLAAASYPVAVVLLGQKAMPSFAATLSDQQIADVITYVRTHFGNAYSDRVTAAQVAAVPRSSVQ